MSYIRAERFFPVLLMAMCLGFVLVGIISTFINGWVAAALVAVAAVVALPSIFHLRQAPQKTPAQVKGIVNGQPRERRTAVLADGTEKTGLVIPLERDHVWELVLTRDGYVLVDENRRVRHHMKTL